MSGGLHVVKMSGAGNDFVVLGPEEARAIAAERVAWARRVCRRGLSVGADGVILVEPAGQGRVRVTFVNPDGSEAFCGNGSRCAARFARELGLVPARHVLETAAGEVPAEVLGERVRLELAAPRHEETLTLTLDGAPRVVERWFAGTGHVVAFVEDPAAVPLERWGPIVRGEKRFAPPGVNFNVARLSGSELHLRTWEKGVERETLACGSGALAAAAAARRSGAPSELRVVPPSGIPLEVRFTTRGPVQLEGDARFVFEGTLSDEALSGYPDG